MSKKSRIIFWIVVAVLVLGVVAIILTQTINTAQQISVTDFERHVEVAQFFESTDKGHKVKDSYPADQKIEDYKDGEYSVGTKGEGENTYKFIYRTSDSKKTEIKPVFKVEISAYEYNGYTVSGGKWVKTYYCYGSSLYGAEGKEYQNLWASYGVDVSMANPNAGPAVIQDGRTKLPSVGLQWAVNF